MECFFKRYHFLNADGTIDKAAADKYLDKKLQGNDEWLKVVKTVVAQCLEAVEVDYDKMMQFFNANQMKVAKPEECPMKPTLVSICVSAKTFAVSTVNLKQNHHGFIELFFFQKCPEKSWNQSIVLKIL